MRKFEDLFEKNWDIVLFAIIAAICFEVMSYGRSVLEKTIFVIFTSLILVTCYTSFQYIEQYKKGMLPILLLAIIWMILLALIVLFIPLLVSFTSLFI